MNGLTTRRRRRYTCHRSRGGCAREIDAAGVEGMVDTYMIDLLSRPAVIKEITTREQRLNDALTAQVANLEAKWAAGELIDRAYQRAKPVLDKRLATERARLDNLAEPASPVSLDAAADWAEARDDEKRVYITRFGVQVVIGAPLRGSGLRGGSRFDPGRVRISRP